MILSILFVIAMMIYFHFESNIQQDVFPDDEPRVDSSLFHLWRILGCFGIIMSIILFSFIQDYLILFLSMTAGLSWYEEYWLHKRYGGIFKHKDRVWKCWKIKIEHPPGIVWFSLFIISLIGIVLRII